MLRISNLFKRKPSQVFISAWMRCSRIIPARPYLRVQFRLKMGYWPNVASPKAMCEKFLWIKLHDRNPLYTTLADKIDAKIWLQEHYGDSYIIKTLAIFDNVNEIQLANLPEKFVIKCNHDSGTVFLCPSLSKGVYYDKHMHTHSFDEVKKMLNYGLHQNYYYNNKEWCYKDINRRIFVEEYLECKNGSIPNDYKLFFFNGKFEFVYVSYDRAGVDDRCMYDVNWQRLPFVMDETSTHSNTAEVPKPASFEEMVKLGEKIAKKYRCVRIDFYDVDGKVYFGEITQFHSAGYAKFTPSKYDLIFGEKINIIKSI